MLGFVNMFILQWFFIRLFVAEADGTPQYWGVLYWIVPTTGWNSEYKSLGKVKYWYIN